MTIDRLSVYSVDGLDRFSVYSVDGSDRLSVHSVDDLDSLSVYSALVDCLDRFKILVAVFLV